MATDLVVVAASEEEANVVAANAVVEAANV